MLFIGIALFFIGTVALLEYVSNQMKNPASYIYWFLFILAALYAGKVYGFAQDDFITKNEIRWDKFEAPTYEELDDDLFSEFDYDCKFVPPGTPSSYINEDDTLSKEVLRIIKSTNKVSAYESRRLHKEHAHDYYRKVKDFCWYFPDISMRERLKSIFLAAAAAVPGPLQTKTAIALLALFTQYGVYCIDGYYEMEFNLNMSKYHFNMVNAFRDHIKDKGW